MWGEISSSSWGKETIRDRVNYVAMYDAEHEIWEMNKTRGNQLKMTQTKILELRIEVLVNAMTECHMAVATRKMWKEIEASMDAVGIAWDKIRRTRSEFGSDAGLNFDHLPMMVEMVLTKATKYLAKAQAKMEKWWEAQVQAWEAEKASEQPRESSYEMPCDDEDRGKELNDKVNEVEPEVSNVNKVNEVNVSEVNVNANEVNDDKVAGSGDVKAMMLFYALCNWMFYTSDALVALCMARFVNGFRRECPIDLSDYG